MSARLIDRCGGATLSKTTPDGGKRTGPRVVLAGAAFAARVADGLRRRGWDVHTADSAEAAARLAVQKRAGAVLIPAETGGESGFLTCAKMLRTRPDLTVVLVGRERTDRAVHLAEFVGGAFATEATLAEEVGRLVA